MSLHGYATVVPSIAVEGTLSLTDGAALVLDNQAQRSTIETLVLNQSKLGGRSPVVMITGTFDWEDGGELAGPGRMTITSRAAASFDPGPGGRGKVRTHLVIDGRFDLASGAIDVGALITARGYLNVVNSSPTGEPAGLLDAANHPVSVVNRGTYLDPGEPAGTRAQPPRAGP